MNKKRLLAGTLAGALALTCFAGCGKKEEGGVAEISWYLSGVKQDSSYDDVWNKANEILEDKYNMKLNIVLTDGTNYSQKIQMMNASREEYDLAFTSNWTNSYYTNIENGSLTDLTELLPKKAPKLWASLTEAEKLGATVDGKIWAVPNWQVQARAMGFSFPKEKLDKTSWKIDDFENMEDFESYLREIVALEPESNKLGGGWQVMMTYYGMSTVVQEGLPGVIYYEKEGKPTIVNQFETPEFMEFAQLMRKWVKEGLMPDFMQTKSYSSKEVFQNPGSWQNWKPGLDKEFERSLKYPVYQKQISPAILSTESIISTMTGVGANSTHPEKAVEMLEVIHTDKDIYNLLSWGIEGVNYEKIDDTFIRVKENSTYTMSNWALGSVKNSYITEGNPADLWEKTEEFNNSAVVSPLMGFSLDNSTISAELGNCETVIKEYLETIQYGLKDPEETVAALNADLKVAGVDYIISEVQRQVDEWWEANKK